jgi:membrane fusion protein (multidrug efflux system)
MMKRLALSVFFSGVIIAVGALASVCGYHIRAQRLADQSSKANQDQAVSVKIGIVKPSPMDDRLLLTGVAEPWEDILVSAEATGKIERQAVEEGAAVKAGDVIFHIDTSLIQAQMEQVQAQERLAVQELQRAQSMSTKGIATGQAMDKAKADRDVSAANLRLFQIRLEKSVAAAPLEGVIDKLFKKQNEFVDTGTPLFRLVQVHKLKIKVGIPEREIGCFVQGDKAAVTMDALAGKTFDGTIYKIAPTADPRTLTFPTEIEVANPENAARPGMISRVALVRKRYEEAISIPLFSVLPLDNQRFVFVENEGKARMRQIQTGVIQGNMVQVLSGLSAGDRLIVTGQRDLQDGDTVKVLETADQ